MKDEKVEAVQLYIKGIAWRVFVLPDEVYNAAHTDESAGLCDQVSFFIHIKKSCLDLPTILHELFHAYCGSCFTAQYGELSAHDMQELGAEITAHHGEEILGYGKKVLKELKKIAKGLK